MEFNRIAYSAAPDWKLEETAPLLPEKESVEAKETPGFFEQIKTSLLCCLFPKRSVLLDAPHDFAAVTRHLKHREEWLAKGEKRQEEVQALSDKLGGADWEAIGADYSESLDDLPIDALKAFHEGRIKMEQFCNCLMFWSSRKAFANVEIHRLFNEDGSVNPLAENFIRQTLEPTGKFSSQPPFLDEEKLALFFRKMKLQPKSERVFFSVIPKTILRPLDQNERAQKTEDGTLLITEAIYDEGINLFNQYTHEGQTRRMIPNITMMQQLLNILAGEEDAVRITPVIGISSLDEIVRNGETDTRDLALPFLSKELPKEENTHSSPDEWELLIKEDNTHSPPHESQVLMEEDTLGATDEMELPKEVDTLSAPDAIDVIIHDLYHSILACLAGRKYRKGFMVFAKAVKELRQKSTHPRVCQILDQLHERVIDMEASAFHRTMVVATPPFSNPTGGQKLLYALNFQLADTAIRASTATYRKKGEQDQISEALTLSLVLSKERVIIQLAEILHRVNFCARFGITRQDLKAMNDATEAALSAVRQQIALERSLDRWRRKPPEQMIEFDGEQMTQTHMVDLQFGEAARKTNLPLQLLELMGPGCGCF